VIEARGVLGRKGRDAEDVESLFFDDGAPLLPAFDLPAFGLVCAVKTTANCVSISPAFGPLCVRLALEMPGGGE
jgi:hypothetical protein